MDDRRIIELYWQRDAQAIAESNGKYGGYCFAIANNILSSSEDAEEGVNDTWLRAWNAMPPKRPDRLRLFFARIVRNISFNRYEAIKAKKRGGGEISLVLDELSECIAAETDIEGEYQARELGRSIRRFVSGLPAREADIFVRRYFFTEPVAAIARRFGLTENNTAVILSRTRRKLRACLEREGYFDEQE